jgi:thioredoxin reductase (NADPH)
MGLFSFVGEGWVVISDVHRYLADRRNSFAAEPNSALEALRSASAAAKPQDRLER